MKLKYNDWYFRYRIREYEFGVRFDILSQTSNNGGMDLNAEPQESFNADPETGTHQMLVADMDTGSNGLEGGFDSVWYA